MHSGQSSLSPAFRLGHPLWIAPFFIIPFFSFYFFFFCMKGFHFRAVDFRRNFLGLLCSFKKYLHTAKSDGKWCDNYAVRIYFLRTKWLRFERHRFFSSPVSMPLLLTDTHTHTEIYAHKEGLYTRMPDEMWCSISAKSFFFFLRLKFDGRWFIIGLFADWILDTLIYLVASGQKCAHTNARTRWNYVHWRVVNAARGQSLIDTM